MEQCGAQRLIRPFLAPPTIEGPEGGLVDPVRTRRFVRLTKEQVMIERRLEMHAITVFPRLKHQRVPDPLPALMWRDGPRPATIRRRVGLVHGFDLRLVRHLAPGYANRTTSSKVLFYEVVVRHLTFVHKTTIHIFIWTNDKLTQNR